MAGELDAGNPHVQFDEGAQETCDIRNAPVPYSTAALAILSLVLEIEDRVGSLSITIPGCRP